VGLVVSATALGGGISAASASASTAARTQLAGSLTPATERSQPQGAVPASNSVSFDLTLQLRDASGAEAEARAVSDPASAQYRHYLTDAQWNATYAPTQAEVSAASSWLRQEGFSVAAVPRDRLFVSAAGTAARVEKAFSTSLSYYKVNGETVRLANDQLSVPSSIAGSVSGVVGVNEYLETTPLTTGDSAPKSVAAQPGQEPAPPAGYRNPQPCSSYWGQKIDTADSASLYAPYKSPLAYDICGYTPTQLRDGYRLGTSVAKGDNGSGVTLAIVDAYDSPTLLSDVQTYFRLNDPADMLASSQFTNVEPSTVDDEAECGASGWYPEQALDVEASHSMAPGAGIEFVGANDCQDNSLLAALQTAVTSGASVVTDSWGDD
jgi:subtilase family serine protease